MLLPVPRALKVVVLAAASLTSAALAAEFPDWAYPTCANSTHSAAPGSGRPENAKLAGLPAPYIIEPVKSFVRVVERAQVPSHDIACFIFVPSVGRPRLPD